MIEKIEQGLLLADLKIKNGMKKFLHEEKGGTEIVAILLIIIILIGVAIVFRGQLETLITNLFTKIGTDVNTKMQ